MPSWSPPSYCPPLNLRSSHRGPRGPPNSGSGSVDSWSSLPCVLPHLEGRAGKEGREHLTQSPCWEAARCRPCPTQARLQTPEDPHPYPAPRESCCLERSGGLPAREVPPISFLRQMALCCG